MTDYEKLEYIHFAIQEGIESLKQWRQYEDPELMQALAFVEDLREPYLYPELLEGVTVTKVAQDP